MSLKLPKITNPLGVRLSRKTSFDKKQLRKAFGQFKTGVIIATSSEQSLLVRAKEFLSQADFGNSSLKHLSAKISAKFPAKIPAVASKFEKQSKKLQIFKSLDLFIKSRILEKDLVTKFKNLFSNQLSGMTINSFSSVSLEPPLVSFCIDNNSANLQSFRRNRFFALNILSHEQQGVANVFAKPGNSAKWQFSPFAISKFGNPVFENSLAIIECKRHRVLQMGDHHILFGEVVGFYIKDEMEADRPLAYWRGKYDF